MGSLAAPGDPVPLDAEGAENDAERQVHRLEHGPLLDVELEIGGRALELGPRFDRAVQVDAVRIQRLGKPDPVAVAQLPELVLVRHRARGRRRAEE